MPRIVSRPPFPNSPGSWLASYRYRRYIEGEDLSSPEQIGELLGVSGPTVRRWESGHSEPSHFDLQRFADVCKLTAIETTFLLRAFSAREIEQPPSWEIFRKTATTVLATSFPAYLMDSFFFVRAWNSYRDALDGQPAPMTYESNILRGPLMAVERPNDTEDQEHRLWRWLRDFWFSTAGLCGSVPYQRILKELCALPNFEQRCASPSPRAPLMAGPRAAYAVYIQEFQGRDLRRLLLQRHHAPRLPLKGLRSG